MKYIYFIILSFAIPFLLFGFVQSYFWSYLIDFTVNAIDQPPPSLTETHKIINAWRPLILFRNNPTMLLMLFKMSGCRSLKLMFYQYISILVKYKKELDGNKLRIDYFEELLNDEISKYDSKIINVLSFKINRYVEIEPPIILYTGNADPLDIIACAFLGTRDYKYLEMLEKYSKTDIVARFPYDCFIMNKKKKKKRL